MLALRVSQVDTYSRLQLIIFHMRTIAFVS